MRASLVVNLSLPLEGPPSAMESLHRFADWLDDPRNQALVFASLYQRWAAWSEDPTALETLRALSPDGEVRP